jgi:hypothetical protein
MRRRDPSTKCRRRRTPVVRGIGGWRTQATANAAARRRLRRGGSAPPTCPGAPGASWPEPRQNSGASPRARTVAARRDLRAAPTEVDRRRPRRGPSCATPRVPRTSARSCAGRGARTRLKRQARRAPDARGRLVGRVRRTCDRKTIRVPRRWCRAEASRRDEVSRVAIGQWVLVARPQPRATGSGQVAWCRRLVASLDDRLLTVWDRRRRALARDRLANPSRPDPGDPGRWRSCTPHRSRTAHGRTTVGRQDNPSGALGRAQWRHMCDEPSFGGTTHRNK